MRADMPRRRSEQPRDGIPGLDRHAPQQPRRREPLPRLGPLEAGREPRCGGAAHAEQGERRRRPFAEVLGPRAPPRARRGSRASSAACARSRRRPPDAPPRRRRRARRGARPPRALRPGPRPTPRDASTGGDPWPPRRGRPPPPPRAPEPDRRTRRAARGPRDRRGRWRSTAAPRCPRCRSARRAAADSTASLDPSCSSHVRIGVPSADASGSRIQPTIAAPAISLETSPALREDCAAGGAFAGSFSPARAAGLPAARMPTIPAAPRTTIPCFHPRRVLMARNRSTRANVAGVARLRSAPQRASSSARRRPALAARGGPVPITSHVPSRSFTHPGSAAVTGTTPSASPTSCRPGSSTSRCQARRSRRTRSPRRRTARCRATARVLRPRRQVAG